jgi:hypothetical protein
MILEVLAGLRSAGDASEALGMALPRYYVLERRAVSGMVDALGPRPRGRPRSDEERVRQLTAEVERLQGEVARLESLQRLSQRAIGVPVEPARRAKPGPGMRKPSHGRAKPRAGRVLARLREQDRAPKKPPRTESEMVRGTVDG